MLVVDCWNHPNLIETISFRENRAFFQLKNKFLNFWSFCQNQRGDHMHGILWCPLWSMSKFSLLIEMLVVDGRIHPILIETISFHEKKHFFNLKTSFWIFEFFVKTKGGTTWHAYCGAPFGPCQNFHLLKMLVVDGRNHPILIETISFHEKKHFFNLKTSFWIFEFLVQNQRGDHMTYIHWCPLWSMSKFSLTQNVGCRLWKPSDSNRNYFLSWKQAFFQLKNKFLNFWIFCQNQRGDHMTCILWCPLWSMSKFSLTQNVGPIVETIRILIETISFRWKQAFFQLKNKFLNFWIFHQNQRGDHMTCILWCPLWSMSKFSLHQNVGCRLLKPSEF